MALSASNAPSWRRRRRPAEAVALAFGMLFAGAHDAAALPQEPTPRQVFFTVDAPCTNEADFGRRLSERTPRVVSVDEAHATDRVDVEIRSTDGKAEGSFMIARGNEPTRSRRVEGTTCDEVADVLSLALALTYDHEALLATPPPAAEPASKSEVGPPPAPPPPLHRAPAWHWRVGAHGTLAATRTVPIGGELFTDLANGASVSFRLGVEGRFARTEVGPASLDLLWTFATPSACPVRLRAGRLDVAPCAGFSLGTFAVTTAGTPDDRTVLRPWVAPRASLFASVALTDWLALDAQASLEFPLVRGTYGFREIFAYEVPIALPTFGVGMTFALARDDR
jgi:hypothetical protein